MAKPKKVNILLTTITPLNIHHFQLGLYTIQAFFLEKMRKIRDARFNFNIEIVYPKKKKGQQDHFPIFTQKEIRRISDDLLKRNPSIIGFSCFMWNIDNLLQIAKLIKKRRPDIFIIFGGPEVSYQARELIKKYSFIDVVAINDGEETFYELIQHYFLNKGSLQDIRGIVYRYKVNEVLDTPSRETKLESLPSPYLMNLVDVDVKERSVVIETLRGCPFRCAYCSYHLGSYGKVRFFPMDKVKKELRLLLAKNIPHMIITDDNFNINEGRAIEILDIIAKFKKKPAIDIFLNIYIRKISSQLVKALARAHLFLSIGIQTTSSKTLALINRRSDLALLEENLTILRNANLLFDLQFIIGLPGDTLETFKENLEWGLKFKPFKISFFPLSVMHGTDIYRMASHYHLKFAKTPPYLIVKTDTFSKAQLVAANQIFDAVNLLYNMGLLKQTVVYIREKLDIDYYAIFSTWNQLMHDKKLQKKNLAQLVISFVTNLLTKHRVPIAGHEELFELIKKDLHYYYARYYTRPLPVKTV